MRPLAALTLIALAAAAAWIGARPWIEAPARPPALQAAAPAPAPDFASPPTPPAPPDLTPFVKRPLFSAARRPPPPEAPGLPVEDPNADLLFGRYEIAGVVKLGDKALAMLRDATDGGLIRIRAGDRLDDAEVIDITLESLTFRKAGATVVAPVKAARTGEE